MRRRNLAGLGAGAILLATIAVVLLASRGRAPAVETHSQDEAAQTVATVPATLLPWQQHLDAVGNLRAISGADLAPEIAGIVASIGFTSGEDVAAGQVLLHLRLDDEPGRLAQLQAMESLAETNLARDSKEFAAQAVSHASIDADRATLASYRAQIAAQQALIDEKTIRAPFAGRLGIRLVDLGQYLQPGTTIATLQALDPIYADFNVPENRLEGVRIGETVEVALSGTDDIGAAADHHAPVTARIIAITPKVDQSSRTVQVRAELANPSRDLLPGMFVHVRVAIGAVHPRVTLPQAALSFTTYGTTVFVVEHGRAHARLVRTGDVRGEQVAILHGLDPGETVVSAGQIKLHDGTPVTVNNAIEPGDAAAIHAPEE